MAAELFHANGQTNVTKLTVAFHNTADVPKNGPTTRTDYTVLLFYKVRVKCTLVQALRLCTGRTAHRGSRGIAILFLDHGTRRGCGVSVTLRPLFSPGKDPLPTVQEIGWAPAPVWTGAENLSPTEIRSPNRPARCQSLYRLSYPARYCFVIGNKNSDQLHFCVFD